MASCGIATGLLLVVLSAIAAVNSATITGSAILVTVDKNGTTEILVGKPEFNESQIITFLAALNPFLHPIQMNSRPTRSTEDIFATNVTNEQIVLVAPTWWESGKSTMEDEYSAYLLPKGLNSMPDEMKNQILSSAEGKRKIGLLMYPADITYFPNMVYSALFPLETMTIKDVRMVDKDMTGLKVNVFMDVFGNARVGMYDAPWLILREVPEDTVLIEGEDAMKQPVEQVPMEEAAMDKEAIVEEAMEKEPMEGATMEEAAMEDNLATSRRKRAPDAEVSMSGGVGTIMLNDNGKVTWSVIPYVGVPPLIPTPPFPPIPTIPPIPSIPFPDWPFFSFNPFWFLQYPYWPYVASEPEAAVAQK